MTDETPDNVVKLAEAFDNPSRSVRGNRRKKDETPPPSQPPTGGHRPPPTRLPREAPVKALGKLKNEFYFLNKSGEFISLIAKEISRNNIIALFGGDEYLVANWPSYNKDGEPTGEFKHGRLSPVLIASCEEMGLWDPSECVRDVGTWVEEDGTLVMHCGDILYTSGTPSRAGVGLRGRLLYPGAPRLPEPAAKATSAAAETVLELFETWNFDRGAIDGRLLLGWIGAAILGAAPEWRPMCWITGGRGTGKSTLLKLVKWILSKGSFIAAADATPAFLSQKIANSSRPVLLDELESTEDNRRARAIIDLMRIASSGDERGRGSPGGQAMTFTVRNAFLASSIIIPPLRPADRSRLCILELHPIENKQVRETGGDDEDAEDDPLLGDRERWQRIGRELRKRLLDGWPRYADTFRAYRKALRRHGHDARAADQFGALGAAYDLLMFDALDVANPDAWGAALPASTLAETSGSESDESACLAHLLAAKVQALRGGSHETVAHWLRTAREDKKNNNDPDATRELAKHGMLLFRDARVDPDSKQEVWRLAISNTHDGLSKIFAGTQWAGAAGATNAWPQMFKRLPGAMTHGANGKPLRLRIDGPRHYVTVLPWDTLFPDLDAQADADVIELVDQRDR